MTKTRLPAIVALVLSLISPASAQFTPSQIHSQINSYFYVGADTTGPEANTVLQNMNVSYVPILSLGTGALAALYEPVNKITSPYGLLSGALVGTSGGVLCLLNADCVWSAPQTWSITAVSPSISSAMMTLNMTYSGSDASFFSPLNWTYYDRMVMPASVSGPYGYSLLYQTYYDTAGFVGIRPGVTFQSVMEQPSSNSGPASQYVALSSNFIAGTPDGGVLGTPKGIAFGANPVVNLNSGATYWAGAIGTNTSAAVNSGASSYRRIALQAESDGAGSAISIDAAIDIWHSAGQVQWSNGIFVDDSQNLLPTTGGEYPIATGGTVIKFGFGDTVSTALFAGLDMHMLTTTWGSGGDAIVLPAGNGGISFGINAVGGRIVSTVNTEGPVLQFQSNDLRVLMGSTVVFDQTAVATVVNVPLNLFGQNSSTAVQINAFNSDYVNGSIGSGFSIAPTAATGNADTVITTYKAGNTANSTLRIASPLGLYNSTSWVAASNCGALSSSTKCLAVVDPNGNTMYIPAYGTY